jgi:chromosome segregation ATPase
MTLTEFMSTLANRLTAVESRIAALPDEPAAQSGGQAELTHAIEEIAMLRARIADLTALVQSTTSAYATLRVGLAAAQADAKDALDTSERLRDGLEAVRTELDGVRAAQGDLADLERLASTGQAVLSPA